MQPEDSANKTKFTSQLEYSRKDPPSTSTTTSKTQSLSTGATASEDEKSLWQQLAEATVERDHRRILPLWEFLVFGSRRRRDGFIFELDDDYKQERRTDDSILPEGSGLDFVSLYRTQRDNVSLSRGDPKAGPKTSVQKLEKAILAGEVSEAKSRIDRTKSDKEQIGTRVLWHNEIAEEEKMELLEGDTACVVEQVNFRRKRDDRIAKNEERYEEHNERLKKLLEVKTLKRQMELEVDHGDSGGAAAVTAGQVNATSSKTSGKPKTGTTADVRDEFEFSSEVVSKADGKVQVFLSPAKAQRDLRKLQTAMSELAGDAEKDKKPTADVEEDDPPRFPNIVDPTRRLSWATVRKGVRAHEDWKALYRQIEGNVHFKEQASSDLLRFGTSPVRGIEVGWTNEEADEIFDAAEKDELRQEVLSRNHGTAPFAPPRLNLKVARELKQLTRARKVDGRTFAKLTDMEKAGLMTQKIMGVGDGTAKNEKPPTSTELLKFELFLDKRLAFLPDDEDFLDDDFRTFAAKKMGRQHKHSSAAFADDLDAGQRSTAAFADLDARGALHAVRKREREAKKKLLSLKKRVYVRNGFGPSAMEVLEGKAAACNLEETCSNLLEGYLSTLASATAASMASKTKGGMSGSEVAARKQLLLAGSAGAGSAAAKKARLAMLKYRIAADVQQACFQAPPAAARPGAPATLLRLPASGTSTATTAAAGSAPPPPGGRARVVMQGYPSPGNCSDLVLLHRIIQLQFVPVSDTDEWVVINQFLKFDRNLADCARWGNKLILLNAAARVCVCEQRAELLERELDYQPPCTDGEDDSDNSSSAAEGQEGAKGVADGAAGPGGAGGFETFEHLLMRRFVWESGLEQFTNKISARGRAATGAKEDQVVDDEKRYSPANDFAYRLAPAFAAGIFDAMHKSGGIDGFVLDAKLKTELVFFVKHYLLTLPASSGMMQQAWLSGLELLCGTSDTNLGLLGEKHDMDIDIASQMDANLLRRVADLLVAGNWWRGSDSTRVDDTTVALAGENPDKLDLDWEKVTSVERAAISASGAGDNLHRDFRLGRAKPVVQNESIRARLCQLGIAFVLDAVSKNGGLGLSEYEEAVGDTSLPGDAKESGSETAASGTGILAAIRTFFGGLLGRGGPSKVEGGTAPVEGADGTTAATQEQSSKSGSSSSSSSSSASSTTSTSSSSSSSSSSKESSAPKENASTAAVEFDGGASVDVQPDKDLAKKNASAANEDAAEPSEDGQRPLGGPTASIPRPRRATTATSSLHLLPVLADSLSRLADMFLTSHTAPEREPRNLREHEAGLRAKSQQLLDGLVRNIKLLDSEKESFASGMVTLMLDAFGQTGCRRYSGTSAGGQGAGGSGTGVPVAATALMQGNAFSETAFTPEFAQFLCCAARLLCAGVVQQQYGGKKNFDLQKIAFSLLAEDVANKTELPDEKSASGKEEKTEGSKVNKPDTAEVPETSAGGRSEPESRSTLSLESLSAEEVFLRFHAGRSKVDAVAAAPAADAPRGAKLGAADATSAPPRPPPQQPTEQPHLLDADRVTQTLRSVCRRFPVSLAYGICGYDQMCTLAESRMRLVGGFLRSEEFRTNKFERHVTRYLAASWGGASFSRRTGLSPTDHYRGHLDNFGISLFRDFAHKKRQKEDLRSVYPFSFFMLRNLMTAWERQVLSEDPDLAAAEEAKAKLKEEKKKEDNKVVDNKHAERGASSSAIDKVTLPAVMLLQEFVVPHWVSEKQRRRLEKNKTKKPSYEDYNKFCDPRKPFEVAMLFAIVAWAEKARRTAKKKEVLVAAVMTALDRVIEVVKELIAPYLPAPPPVVQPVVVEAVIPDEPLSWKPYHHETSNGVNIAELLEADDNIHDRKVISSLWVHRELKKTSSEAGGAADDGGSKTTAGTSSSSGDYSGGTTGDESQMSSHSGFAAGSAADSKEGGASRRGEDGEESDEGSGIEDEEEESGADSLSEDEEERRRRLRKYPPLTWSRMLGAFVKWLRRLFLFWAQGTRLARRRKQVAFRRWQLRYDGTQINRLFATSVVNRSDDLTDLLASMHRAALRDRKEEDGGEHQHHHQHHDHLREEEVENEKESEDHNVPAEQPDLDLLDQEEEEDSDQVRDAGEDGHDRMKRKKPPSSTPKRKLRRQFLGGKPHHRQFTARGRLRTDRDFGMKNNPAGRSAKNREKPSVLTALVDYLVDDDGADAKANAGGGSSDEGEEEDESDDGSRASDADSDEVSETAADQEGELLEGEGEGEAEPDEIMVGEDDDDEEGTAGRPSSTDNKVEAGVRGQKMIEAQPSPFEPIYTRIDAELVRISRPDCGRRARRPQDVDVKLDQLQPDRDARFVEAVSLVEQDEKLFRGHVTHEAPGAEALASFQAFRACYETKLYNERQLRGVFSSSEVFFREHVALPVLKELFVKWLPRAESRAAKFVFDARRRNKHYAAMRRPQRRQKMLLQKTKAGGRFEERVLYDPENPLQVLRDLGLLGKNGVIGGRTESDRDALSDSPTLPPDDDEIASAEDRRRLRTEMRLRDIREKILKEKNDRESKIASQGEKFVETEDEAAPTPRHGNSTRVMKMPASMAPAHDHGGKHGDVRRFGTAALGQMNKSSRGGPPRLYYAEPRIRENDSVFADLLEGPKEAVQKKLDEQASAALVAGENEWKLSEYTRFAIEQHFGKPLEQLWPGEIVRLEEEPPFVRLKGEEENKEELERWEVNSFDVRTPSVEEDERMETATIVGAPRKSKFLPPSVAKRILRSLALQDEMRKEQTFYDEPVGQKHPALVEDEEDQEFSEEEEVDIEDEEGVGVEADGDSEEEEEEEKEASGSASDVYADSADLDAESVDEDEEVWSPDPDQVKAIFAGHKELYGAAIDEALNIDEREARTFGPSSTTGRPSGRVKKLGGLVGVDFDQECDPEGTVASVGGRFVERCSVAIAIVDTLIYLARHHFLMAKAREIAYDEAVKKLPAEQTAAPNKPPPPPDPRKAALVALATRFATQLGLTQQTLEDIVGLGMPTLSAKGDEEDTDPLVTAMIARAREKFEEKAALVEQDEDWDSEEEILYDPAQPNGDKLKHDHGGEQEDFLPESDAPFQIKLHLPKTPPKTSRVLSTVYFPKAQLQQLAREAALGSSPSVVGVKFLAVCSDGTPMIPLDAQKRLLFPLDLRDGLPIFPTTTTTSTARAGKRSPPAAGPASSAAKEQPHLEYLTPFDPETWKPAVPVHILSQFAITHEKIQVPRLSKFGVMLFPVDLDGVPLPDGRNRLVKTRAKESEDLVADGTLAQLMFEGDYGFFMKAGEGGGGGPGPESSVVGAGAGQLFSQGSGKFLGTAFLAKKGVKGEAPLAPDSPLFDDLFQPLASADGTTASGPLPLLKTGPDALPLRPKKGPHVPAPPKRKKRPKRKDKAKPHLVAKKKKGVRAFFGRLFGLGGGHEWQHELEAEAKPKVVGKAKPPAKAKATRGAVPAGNRPRSAPAKNRSLYYPEAEAADVEVEIALASPLWKRKRPRSLRKRSSSWGSSESVSSSRSSGGSGTGSASADIEETVGGSRSSSSDVDGDEGKGWRHDDDGEHLVRAASTEASASRTPSLPAPRSDSPSSTTTSMNAYHPLASEDSDHLHHCHPDRITRAERRARFLRRRTSADTSDTTDASFVAAVEPQKQIQEVRKNATAVDAGASSYRPPSPASSWSKSTASESSPAFLFAPDGAARGKQSKSSSRSRKPGSSSSSRSKKRRRPPRPEVRIPPPEHPVLTLTNDLQQLSQYIIRERQTRNGTLIQLGRETFGMMENDYREAARLLRTVRLHDPVEEQYKLEKALRKRMRERYCRSRRNFPVPFGGSFACLATDRFALRFSDLVDRMQWFFLGAKAAHKKYDELEALLKQNKKLKVKKPKLDLTKPQLNELEKELKGPDGRYVAYPGFKRWVVKTTIANTSKNKKSGDETTTTTSAVVALPEELGGGEATMLNVYDSPALTSREKMRLILGFELDWGRTSTDAHDDEHEPEDPHDTSGSAASSVDAFPFVTFSFIDPGSKAAQLKVVVGDVLVAIKGKRVARVAEWPGADNDDRVLRAVLDIDAVLVDLKTKALELTRTTNKGLTNHAARISKTPSAPLRHFNGDPIKVPTICAFRYERYGGHYLQVVAPGLFEKPLGQVLALKRSPSGTPAVKAVRSNSWLEAWNLKEDDQILAVEDVFVGQDVLECHPARRFLFQQALAGKVVDAEAVEKVFTSSEVLDEMNRSVTAVYAKAQGTKPIDPRKRDSGLRPWSFLFYRARGRFPRASRDIMAAGYLEKRSVDVAGRPVLKPKHFPVDLHCALTSLVAAGGDREVDEDEAPTATSTLMKKHRQIGWTQTQLYYEPKERRGLELDAIDPERGRGDADEVGAVGGFFNLPLGIGGVDGLVGDLGASFFGLARTRRLARELAAKAHAKGKGKKGKLSQPSIKSATHAKHAASAQRKKSASPAAAKPKPKPKSPPAKGRSPKAAVGANKGNVGKCKNKGKDKKGAPAQSPLAAQQKGKGKASKGKGKKGVPPPIAFFPETDDADFEFRFDGLEGDNPWHPALALAGVGENAADEQVFEAGEEDRGGAMDHVPGSVVLGLESDEATPGGHFFPAFFDELQPAEREFVELFGIRLDFSRVPVRVSHTMWEELEDRQDGGDEGRDEGASASESAEDGLQALRGTSSSSSSSDTRERRNDFRHNFRARKAGVAVGDVCIGITIRDADKAGGAKEYSPIEFVEKKIKIKMKKGVAAPATGEDEEVLPPPPKGLSAASLQALVIARLLEEIKAGHDADTDDPSFSGALDDRVKGRSKKIVVGFRFLREKHRERYLHLRFFPSEKRFGFDLFNENTTPAGTPPTISEVFRASPAAVRFVQPGDEIVAAYNPPLSGASRQSRSSSDDDNANAIFTDAFELRRLFSCAPHERIKHRGGKKKEPSLRPELLQPEIESVTDVLLFRPEGFPTWAREKAVILENPFRVLAARAGLEFIETGMSTPSKDDQEIELEFLGLLPPRAADKPFGDEDDSDTSAGALPNIREGEVQQNDGAAAAGGAPPKTSAAAAEAEQSGGFFDGFVVAANNYDSSSAGDDEELKATTKARVFKRIWNSERSRRRRARDNNENSGAGAASGSAAATAEVEFDEDEDDGYSARDEDTASATQSGPVGPGEDEDIAAISVVDDNYSSLSDSDHGATAERTPKRFLWRRGGEEGRTGSEISDILEDRTRGDGVGDSRREGILSSEEDGSSTSEGGRRKNHDGKITSSSEDTATSEEERRIDTRLKAMGENNAERMRLRKEIGKFRAELPKLQKRLEAKEVELREVLRSLESVETDTQEAALAKEQQRVRLKKKLIPGLKKELRKKQAALLGCENELAQLRQIVLEEQLELKEQAHALMEAEARASERKRKRLLRTLGRKSSKDDADESEMEEAEDVEEAVTEATNDLASALLQNDLVRQILPREHRKKLESLLGNVLAATRGGRDVLDVDARAAEEDAGDGEEEQGNDTTSKRTNVDRPQHLDDMSLALNLTIEDQGGVDEVRAWEKVKLEAHSEQRDKLRSAVYDRIAFFTKAGQLHKLLSVERETIVSDVKARRAYVAETETRRWIKLRNAGKYQSAEVDALDLEKAENEDETLQALLQKLSAKDAEFEQLEEKVLEAINRRAADHEKDAEDAEAGEDDENEELKLLHQSDMESALLLTLAFGDADAGKHQNQKEKREDTTSEGAEDVASPTTALGLRLLRKLEERKLRRAFKTIDYVDPVYRGGLENNKDMQKQHKKIKRELKLEALKEEKLVEMRNARIPGGFVLDLFDGDLEKAANTMIDETVRPAKLTKEDKKEVKREQKLAKAEMHKKIEDNMIFLGENAQFVGGLIERTAQKAAAPARKKLDQRMAEVNGLARLVEASPANKLARKELGVSLRLGEKQKKKTKSKSPGAGPTDAEDGKKDAMKIAHPQGGRLPMPKRKMPALADRFRKEKASKKKGKSSSSSSSSSEQGKSSSSETSADAPNSGR